MKTSKFAVSASQATRALAPVPGPEGVQLPRLISRPPAAIAGVLLARRGIAQEMIIRRRTLQLTNACYRPRRAYGSSTEPGKPDENAAIAEGGLSKTKLHSLHIDHGGKMVPFAGYSMPVQYSDLSVGDSHRWTREKASLFDVGHMVQHHISGSGAAAFLEMITPTSIANLKPNHSTLSCLLHPFTGGIVDDTVITRLGPQLFHLVTNAACKNKDQAYLEEQLQAFDTSLGKVNWEVMEGWGLVALQGPLSVDVLHATLQKMGNEKVNLQELYFGQCVSAGVRVPDSDATFPLLISRGGYTGEDGFEISIPPQHTDTFAKLLLGVGGQDRLRLAGLGARDSLRLEAGMCLYGHDLDDNTTPVEAGLSWIIPKDRRIAGGFHGHEIILRQLKPTKEGGGVERRRVGLVVQGAPAREGAEIVGKDDEAIGKVTSGCPSPTVGKNIAMGYVKEGMHKAGTEVGVKVRGKRRNAQVVKMPFVASKYWKQAAGTSPG